MMRPGVASGAPASRRHPRTCQGRGARSAHVVSAGSGERLRGRGRHHVMKSDRRLYERRDAVASRRRPRQRECSEGRSVARFGASSARCDGAERLPMEVSTPTPIMGRSGRPGRRGRAISPGGLAGNAAARGTGRAAAGCYRDTRWRSPEGARPSLARGRPGHHELIGLSAAPRGWTIDAGLSAPGSLRANGSLGKFESTRRRRQASAWACRPRES